MGKASRVRGTSGVIPWHQGTPVGSKGSARVLAQYLIHGLRCGMQDMGVQSIPMLHKNLEEGSLRMECQTAHAAQSRETRKQSLMRSEHPELLPAVAAGG